MDHLRRTLAMPDPAFEHWTRTDTAIMAAVILFVVLCSGFALAMLAYL